MRYARDSSYKVILEPIYVFGVITYYPPVFPMKLFVGTEIKRTETRGSTRRAEASPAPTRYLTTVLSPHKYEIKQV